MSRSPLFQGKRVALRAMEPEDLDVLYTIENDTTLWDVSSVNVLYSRFALKEFIAKSGRDIYVDGQLRLLVETVEGHEVVGVADLVDYTPRHQRAEVGLVIKKAYRGQGIGLEVLQLLECYAREILHLHQLYAYVSLRNDASLRLFQRAGYEGACVLKSWHREVDDFIDTKIFQKIF